MPVIEEIKEPTAVEMALSEAAFDKAEPTDAELDALVKRFRWERLQWELKEAKRKK